ncbi:MAG: hypothetical protein EXR27_12000 [Betaproteobacteria bacterium]|nr:hypothetical protein [Betaproteobacteria bacterium]
MKATDKRALRRFFDVMDRERRHMQTELGQIKGLMPLLMKPRNKNKWTAQDKRELQRHFKQLSKMSPYIAALVLPGGFAILPVLAWWLDHRRGRRLAGAAAKS